MIPKIIHYCWLGKKPIPEKDRLNIESWKKYCPDYEIKEWNEDNFDVDCCQYSRETYDDGKYGLTSDVVRLVALSKEGGIYLDTDVELFKPFDDLLDQTAFIGFESKKHIGSGILGAEKGAKFITDKLKTYETRRYIQPDGSNDKTAIVVSLTDYMIERGMRLDDSIQKFPGLITVYPRRYFCPKKNEIFGYTRTKDTYTIHYFSGSWQLHATPEYKRLRRKYKWIPYFIRKKLILAILGENKKGFFPTLIRIFPIH